MKGVPLAAFTVAHAKDVMGSLPVAWKVGTRRHVARLLHRVLSLAVWPVEAIKANPLPKGFLPKKQRGRVGAVFYPDEDAKLVSAPSEKLPLQARVVLASLNRLRRRGRERDHSPRGRALGLSLETERDRAARLRRWATS